jgi:ABC-2 type transport system permease protein
MSARRWALATGTLVEREMVRFLRQRNRLIGALMTPLMFWFFLGAGLGGSFRTTAPGAESLTYLQYFLPGTIALVCLFTAIFSTMSVIDDRQAGFLQAVLVSPAPRSAVVAGKMLGGTALSFFQAILFMALLPFLHVPLTWTGGAIALAMILLMSFGLTGLGLMIAWKTDSIQGFHAVMNLFLMPLWFLSGAVFPAAGAPVWLRFLMAINPLSYSVAALHRAFYSSSGGTSLGVCFLVNAAFAALTFVGSLKLVRRGGDIK